uniref:hypothetical protein n=1 Tax=Segatella hominis TaxID=2518605 RepID=UPI0026700668|nr:hypothetical protein [uncultured Prevotella sp.]
MRNEKRERNGKWEMGRHKKTDSLKRPSALDNKNLNSYYRIIEIILIISEVKGVKGVKGVKTIVFLA